MNGNITREQARDMQAAHAEGLHTELPRQFCPDCEGRELSSYPTAASFAAGMSCTCGHPRSQHTRGGVCSANDLDDPSEPCACSSFLAVGAAGATR